MNIENIYRAIGPVGLALIILVWLALGVSGFIFTHKMKGWPIKKIDMLPGSMAAFFGPLVWYYYYLDNKQFTWLDGFVIVFSLVEGVYLMDATFELGSSGSKLSGGGFIACWGFAFIYALAVVGNSNSARVAKARYTK